MSKTSKRELEWRKEDEHSKTFAMMTERGSKEFGVLWLAANNAAVQVAAQLGIDHTKAEIKATMTSAILHALYKAREHYQREAQSGAEGQCSSCGQIIKSDEEYQVYFGTGNIRLTCHSKRCPIEGDECTYTRIGERAGADAVNIGVGLSAEKTKIEQAGSSFNEAEERLELLHSPLSRKLEAELAAAEAEVQRCIKCREIVEEANDKLEAEVLRLTESRDEARRDLRYVIGQYRTHVGDRPASTVISEDRLVAREFAEAADQPGGKKSMLKESKTSLADKVHDGSTELDKNFEW